MVDGNVKHAGKYFGINIPVEHMHRPMSLVFHLSVVIAVKVSTPNLSFLITRETNTEVLWRKKEERKR